MSEKEKKIFETFGETISKMTEEEKSYLIGFGEGMAFRIGLDEKADNVEERMSV